METTVFVILLLLLLGGYVFLKYRSLENSKGLLAREKQAEHESRFNKALPAMAQVVSQESKTSEGRTIVHLVLNVLPPAGTNYVISTDWQVEQAALPNLVPGSEVAVKIDTDDPKRVYPNVSWATHWLWH